jgi:DNA-binding MarR family transcriptional regulator
MGKQGLILSRRELKDKKVGPKTERFVSLIKQEVSIDKLSSKRTKIINLLQEKGEISVKNLTQIIPNASRLIKPMEQAGYISIFNKKI